MNLENTLRKIQLTEELHMEVELPLEDFVSGFNAELEPTTTGVIKSYLSKFFSTQNKYIGEIEDGKIAIESRSNLMYSSFGAIEITGTYKAEGNRTSVDLRISGINTKIKIYTILVVLIYGAAISALIINSLMVKKIFDLFSAPFVFLHGTLFLAIPVLLIRKSVSKTKHDLERDIFYLTRHKNNKIA